MTQATQTILKGYKQTEIGVIPADWDVKKLNHFLDFEQPSKYLVKDAEYSDDYSIPVLTAGKTFLLGYTNETQGVFNNLPVIIFDDFTTAIKFVNFPFKAKSSAMKMLLPKNDKVNLRFIYEIMSRIKYPLGDHKRHWIGEYQFLEIPIPVNESEQTAIATVLSDTDALIENLEKLINKKKAVKQGAMQQLLTGKKRLPGFSGEWVEKRLGKICENVTTGKLDANAMKKDGEYRFYTCAKEYYFIDKYAFDTEALLVSGNGANVGYIHYYKGKFNAYQRTYVLSNFHENIFFTKLLLDKNLKERIRTEVNAGNTPYITMGTLTEMSILFPPTNEEQVVIATILSDIDMEIEKLKNKLSKYRQIKTGMMQQLLTGKIRLVKN